MNKVMYMEIDEEDVHKCSLGEHRQLWLTYFDDVFESICLHCNESPIDVFSFQSDFKLIPLCKDCCHPQYLRKSDSLNREVWMKYIGKHAEVQCLIGCHNKINVYNFEKGHVISSYNNGPKTVENLRPICGPCNKSMGTRHMEEYYNTFHNNKK
jgi:hypothetical protein